MRSARISINVDLNSSAQRSVIRSCRPSAWSTITTRIVSGIARFCENLFPNFSPLELHQFAIQTSVSCSFRFSFTDLRGHRAEERVDVLESPGSRYAHLHK